MLDFTTEEWMRVININLNGSYFFLREVGRVFCRQNHGKVIQILSTGAYRFGANFSADGASKAGVSALIKCLAEMCIRDSSRLFFSAKGLECTTFVRIRQSPRIRPVLDVYKRQVVLHPLV